ncbi:hypothetical protein MKK88_26640 [Methylobacterium sp. E-005]|uniref:hypothetical protein n=1 Tax=Methylobacterium sp. E-005 TaxID=2836549 RepID=UPI001FBB520F|nr:hypothetical protein [Methylobacterium sp. E-005]MCJ2089539.1 hypothetical protein [Methylobacterium sp. E-005]
MVRLIPWWIGLFLLAALFIQRIVSVKFYSDASVGIPIYAGILTLNGLLLTLAWNAFAKIFENICAPKFSTYFRETGVFKIYLYQISYVQAAQIIAVVLSGAALIALAAANPPAGLNEWLFIVVLASTGYALKEAVGAVTILHDLIWYRSIFDAHQEQKNSKVTRLNAQGR